MGSKFVRGACAALVAAVATAILSGAALGATTPSDLGPVGWTSGSGDPNLGVLNQGARTVSFDSGWKFKLVNTSDATDPSGTFGNSSDPRAAATNFDDSGWQRLTLPHDWSITQDPRADQSNATGFFPGGLGWYRKSFTLPKRMAGKRISLDFDGVFDNSYVYLNGQLLGNHPYGYTGYSFDISDLVRADGHTPNVLAVVVQNQEPSSRWYSGSGITRHVHLTVSDPVHIARWGTTVTTPSLADTIKSGYATVHVATQLANDTGRDTDATVRYTVKDPSGVVVARATSSNLSVPTGGANDAVDVRVQHPALWSTTSPKLYSVQTDVSAGDGASDSTTSTFGIRWLVFSPSGGVSLNGKPLKLHGVDLHNDEGALGSVDNYDALWRQMSELKAMGVNAFRTSHNPPSPEMIDVCQRLGIVMMVEAFDAWDTGKLSQDYHLYFNQWSDYDVKEMVDEAKNSPAVIMWSIGNEIPDWTSSQAPAIEQRLISDIRSIDTTRPVVAGSDRYRSVPAPGSAADRMLQNLDGLGLNYDTAKTLDGLHAQYPGKFFFESESSSETSTRGYYQDPQQLNTGQNFTPGKYEVSSYDNNLASWTLSNQYSLQKDRDRAYFAGQFLWSGFDYIGEPTPYSVFPVKTSFFGAIDTAGFPKDGFYMFKSQWTTAPMVHLLPMNWTDYRRGQMVQVRAYATAPTVQLYLNGRSLGTRSFDQKVSTDRLRYLETTECTGDDKTYTSGACPGSYESPNGSSGNLYLRWNVPFQAGRLVAVARNAGGQVVARDEVDTAGRPDALKLTPDKRVLLDDGKSLSYLTASVVDARGVEVPDADNAIKTSVRGAGTFQGADNGKQDDAEGYKSRTHDAFNGQLLSIVQARHRSGPVTVTVSAPGLLPATTTLYSRARPSGGLFAAQPVQVRARVGTSPQLPPTVLGVRGDGFTEPLPVRWTDPPGRERDVGTDVVTGTVRGTDLVAKAIVTAYAVARVERSVSTVPVSTPPALPAAVTVRFTDAVTQALPVRWQAVPADRYSSPGRFTVRGTVAGLGAPAVARVTVAANGEPDQDLALAGGPEHPTADASFSGGVFSGGGSDFGTSTTIPAAMLDGNTSSGGWSNRYSKAATQTLPQITNSHPEDWVSVAWPDAQRFKQLDVYFTQDANDQLPATVRVTYWNGLSWVAVTHQRAAFASGSDQPSTISFEPIATTEVRLDMTSRTPNDPVTGNLTISELEIPGSEVVSSG